MYIYVNISLLPTAQKGRWKLTCTKLTSYFRAGSVIFWYNLNPDGQR